VLYCRGVEIGIRREEKNRFERRAPLTPDHVGELVEEHGLAFRVQPSKRRAFPDKDYEAAGATIAEDLEACPVVLAVKEIPSSFLRADRVYVCFAHVTKGQPANMPALARYLETGATLIDYERIVDEKGRRLIFFGRHAGYAGMLDTLWALGRRFTWEGVETPFSDLRPAHQYADLDEAMDHVGEIGERIRHEGLPRGRRPMVFGFAGSGNVAQGAREVFDRLPFQEVDPEDLSRLDSDRDRPRSVVFRTTFERRHRFRRISDGGFEAAEYRSAPALYEPAMDAWLPDLTVLVNGVYWEPGLPRLVTTAQLEALWEREEQPKLRVIGDITCDVGGSIEANVKTTDPGDPVYVWEVGTGNAIPGVAGRGPVVLAVDNLPCELPREASEHFGDSLLRFVPPMARCDWSAPFARLALPPEISRAVVAHRGSLAPAYRGLERALAGRAGRA
jgi:alpha-aminoadipic semialdehyde synthase